MNSTQAVNLPFKSVAGALIFSLILGPIGLLYASFWGGVIMLLLAFPVLAAMYPYPIILFWLGCSIWSVAAVNSYNKKLLKTLQR